jgi:hypothetical protein
VIMKTGIIGIRFRVEATEDQIQKMISSFYSANKALIEGMEYNEFQDEKPLTQVFKFVAEMDDHHPETEPDFGR